MQRKLFFLTVVFGFSLTVLVPDALAQRRGGRGGAAPAEDNAQAPARGRGRGGSGQPGGRFGGTQSINPLFAALDANSDGVITTVEMEDAIQAFAKLDENKDGKLTVEEAGAARAGGHGHTHGRGGAASGSQGPAAGRGGRGRRGGASPGGPGRGGQNPPGTGRGRRGRGGQLPSGAARPQGEAQPAKPSAVEGTSKSPFDS